MTPIITELVYIFFKGPAEGRLRVRDFLATWKTYWWPSAVVCSMVHFLTRFYFKHFYENTTNDKYYILIDAFWTFGHFKSTLLPSEQ